MQFVINISNAISNPDLKDIEARVRQCIDGGVGAQCDVEVTENRNAHYEAIIVNLQAENIQFRSDVANRYCNAQRLISWLSNPVPASMAFTEGPERQVAYSIEQALYSHRQSDDATTVLKDSASRAVFKDVMEALQNADEIGGPEGVEYITLMGVISAVTQRRLAACKEMLQGEPFEKAA